MKTLRTIRMSTSLLLIGCIISCADEPPLTLPLNVHVRLRHSGRTPKIMFTAYGGDGQLSVAEKKNDSAVEYTVLGYIPRPPLRPGEFGTADAPQAKAEFALDVASIIRHPFNIIVNLGQNKWILTAGLEHRQFLVRFKSGAAPHSLIFGRPQWHYLVDPNGPLVLDVLPSNVAWLLIQDYVPSANMVRPVRAEVDFKATLRDFAKRHHMTPAEAQFADLPHPKTYASKTDQGKVSVFLMDRMDVLPVIVNAEMTTREVSDDVSHLKPSLGEVSYNGPRNTAQVYLVSQIFDLDPDEYERYFQLGPATNWEK